MHDKNLKVEEREIEGRKVYLLEGIEIPVGRSAPVLRTRMALYPGLDDRDYTKGAADRRFLRDGLDGEIPEDGERFPFRVVYRDAHDPVNEWGSSCLSVGAAVDEYRLFISLNEAIDWLIAGEP